MSISKKVRLRCLSSATPILNHGVSTPKFYVTVHILLFCHASITFSLQGLKEACPTLDCVNNSEQATRTDGTHTQTHTHILNRYHLQNVRPCIRRLLSKAEGNIISANTRCLWGQRWQHFFHCSPVTGDTTTRKQRHFRIRFRDGKAWS